MPGLSQEFETELVRNEEGKIVRQTKLDENGNPVLKPTKLINVTVHCG